MHYAYGQWSAQLDLTLCGRDLTLCGRWLHHTRSTYDPMVATCATCLRTLAAHAFTGARHAEDLVRRCAHRRSVLHLHDVHARMVAP